MILTCPECKTRYTLNPSMLGVAGREVRCVTCSHMWFQLPDMPLAEFPKAAENSAEPAQSITEALDSILEKDDAVFEAILSNVNKAGTPQYSTAPSSTTTAPVERIEKQSAPWEMPLPVVTHNPLGVGATTFGMLSFLLCVFLTLAVLFVAQKPIVSHWPQMTLLYNTLGFDVKAPGEGLRISEVIAEQRIDSQGKTLVVQGKMTNMTEHDLSYPALHVTLKDGKDAVMKTWDLKAGATKIAAGDDVPVKLQLNDAPPDGALIEVRVKDK
jgi:predicted Zn finger-like uncharacterized protein